MLDKKTLNLFEMAERGELPEGLYFPFGTTSQHSIYNGKLTEHGKVKLNAYRYEQQQKFRERVSKYWVGVDWGLWPDQTTVLVQDKSDLTAIHSQLGELKYKTESLQERIGQNASAFSTQIGELTKRVEKVESVKPCIFQLTPEQKKQIALDYCEENCDRTPALEWEVWSKDINTSDGLRGAFVTCTFATEAKKEFERLHFPAKYEVRHNPKQVNKER